jgi:ABC-type glycerol-3-phosphate transport system substrate-binding protein
MPRKAVAIYFILALIGAALFIFFTFPRTASEIPTSNNQRPFPSGPGPGNVPVPETQPHPSTPGTPHGPSLRVMAWASPAEAQALGARLDNYAAQTGQVASLTLVNDEATYLHDLPEALASDTPPDVCLVDARDFSGADPVRDFAAVTPDRAAAARSIAAFTVSGTVKALPDEFSVDLLYYSPADFDRAGIAAPGPHWNWDVLEAISRAIASLKLTNAQGAPIYALELPADFDFWNMLCTQAGQPALDVGTWHLGDADSKDAELRSLDFIHTFFQGLSVTAPPPREGLAPGRYFSAQQAAMLIGPSDLTASLPNFGYRVTNVPRDMCSASLAHVNGWAVAANSNQADAAQKLAAFLSTQPVHAGWSAVRAGDAVDGFTAICQSALSESVIPRISAKDEPMAQFLNAQIAQLARQPDGDSGQYYTRIQAQYQSGLAPQPVEGSMPKAAEKLKQRTAPSGEARDM